MMQDAAATAASSVPPSPVPAPRKQVARLSCGSKAPRKQLVADPADRMTQLACPDKLKREQPLAQPACKPHKSEAAISQSQDDRQSPEGAFAAVGFRAKEPRFFEKMVARVQLAPKSKPVAAAAKRVLRAAPVATPVVEGQLMSADDESVGVRASLEDISSPSAQRSESNKKRRIADSDEDAGSDDHASASPAASPLAPISAPRSSPFFAAPSSSAAHSSPPPPPAVGKKLTRLKRAADTDEEDEREEMRGESKEEQEDEEDDSPVAARSSQAALTKRLQSKAYPAGASAGRRGAALAAQSRLKFDPPKPISAPTAEDAAEEKRAPAARSSPVDQRNQGEPSVQQQLVARSEELVQAQKISRRLSEELKETHHAMVELTSAWRCSEQEVQKLQQQLQQEQQQGQSSIAQAASERLQLEEQLRSSHSNRVAAGQAQRGVEQQLADAQRSRDQLAQQLQQGQTQLAQRDAQIILLQQQQSQLYLAGFNDAQERYSRLESQSAVREQEMTERQRSSESSRLVAVQGQRQAEQQLEIVKRELASALQSRDQLQQQLSSRNTDLQQAQTQLRECQARLVASEVEQRLLTNAAALAQTEHQQLLNTLRADLTERAIAVKQLKRKVEEQREEDAKRQRTADERAAELQAANSELESKNEEQFVCCVCLAARPSVLYQPCHHLVVCEACDEGLKARKMPCPGGCNKPIKRRYKLNKVHT